MRAHRLLGITVGLMFGVLLNGAAVHSQRSYIKGLFVATRSGPPVELIAWAEEGPRRRLGMVGSIDDVPVVPNVTRLLCNLPFWKPAGVMIASHQIFTDERAERRYLRFATRPLNIYAIEIRIVELEQRAALERLYHNVRASEDNPAYVFVILQSDGFVRYYPFRIQPNEEKP